MALVSSLAQEGTWLGQCPWSFDVLEDGITDVGERVEHWMSRDEDTGLARLFAKYVVNADHFRGAFLRRPFQGLAHLKVRHARVVSAALLWRHRQPNGQFEDTLLEKSHSIDGVVTFDTFVAPHHVLLCEPMDPSTHHVMMVLGFEVAHAQVDGDIVLPKFIGEATGYRWKMKTITETRMIPMARGFEHGPWMLTARVSPQGISKLMYRPHDDDSEDDSSSESASPTPSEMDTVEHVFHEESDFTQVREALMCPKAIRQTIVCSRHD